MGNERTDETMRLIERWREASAALGPEIVGPALVYLVAEYVACYPPEVHEWRRLFFNKLVADSVPRIARTIEEAAAEMAKSDHD